MSRIRSIHPGLWTDEAFMGLSAHARLLIIGIWTEAFDDGVFEWKPLTLKARIFPVDTVDMAALLDELVAGTFVRREEFDGRQIGLIRNFREFQRPKKPNSSGMMRPEWETFVGISATSSEEVPHQSSTNGEKSPQMEDGGGKREDEDQSPPPVSVADGARDFDDLWEAFPRNPTSNRSKAQAAFSATKAEDRPSILAAARRFASWFAEDCKARKRTLDAGLKFAPHLATWLEDEGWRAEFLVPAPAIAVPPMVKLNRLHEPQVWAACERLQGKKAPTSDAAWSFPLDIVVRARAELASPASVEVH